MSLTKFASLKNGEAILVTRGSYYSGIPKLICEQKHMGSRAVVIVGRTEDAAVKRFGITNEGCAAAEM